MSAIRLVNLVRVRVKQVSKQLIVWEQKSRARPRTVQGLVLRARMAENTNAVTVYIQKATKKTLPGCWKTD